MFRRASKRLIQLQWQVGTILLLSCCGAMASAAQDITVGTTLNFVAPAVERQQKSQFEAHYRAFHDAIMATAGFTSTLSFLPIYEAQAQVARREKDGQVGGICGVKRGSPTIYSLPYASLSRHLITVGGSPVIQQIDDLQGKRLGLVERYFYQLPDDKHLKAMGIQVHRVDAQAHAVAMLASGRIDTLLASPPMVEDIARQHAIEAVFNYTEQPFSEQNLCYVLPKTRRGLMLSERINTAIIQLHQQNRLQQFVQPPFSAPTDAALGLVGPN